MKQKSKQCGYDLISVGWFSRKRNSLSNINYDMIIMIVTQTLTIIFRMKTIPCC